jgi:hypothetical protein
MPSQNCTKPLQQNFSDDDLGRIVDEATIYMCACPAQVAVQLRTLRELYRYQLSCEQDPGADQAVHQTIAAATLQAHELMEQCMSRVLEIEGWDRSTLTMPEGLRRKRDDFLARE